MLAMYINQDSSCLEIIYEEWFKQLLIKHNILESIERIFAKELLFELDVYETYCSLSYALDKYLLMRGVFRTGESLEVIKCKVGYQLVLHDDRPYE